MPGTAPRNCGSVGFVNGLGLTVSQGATEPALAAMPNRFGVFVDNRSSECRIPVHCGGERANVHAQPSVIDVDVNLRAQIPESVRLLFIRKFAKLTSKAFSAGTIP